MRSRQLGNVGSFAAMLSIISSSVPDVSGMTANNSLIVRDAKSCGTDFSAMLGFSGMVNLTLSMLKETNKFIETGNLKNVKRLEEYEELVDFLQKEITDFLVALSQKSVSGRTSEELATLMHLVNDIERIGDHCVNLWKLGQRKVEARIAFSEIGLSELADISGKTEDFLTYVVVGLESNNPALCSESIRFEDEIDDLEKTLRNNHIDRLNTGECAVKPGMIFIDMLHNYEKIGDHTYNIAEAILENQG